MDLWPAIDLRGGRCVRLLQGDYDRETVFADDPVEQVRRFVDQGARRLHVVDLDGAKSGSPVQAELIARMVRAAGVPCQLGGGIRSLDTARAYADAGVSRLVVGSVAIEQPELLAAMAAALPGRIVLGLDARDGRVAVRGWVDTSPLLALDVAKRSEHLPLAGVVYTDIATDGMLTGPNWASLEAVLQACPCGVIASGGVAGTEDVARLAQMAKAYPNLVGAIVGKALYEGRCDVAGLLQACR